MSSKQVFYSIALAISILAGCSPQTTSEEPIQTVVHDDEIPHAMLGNNVVPTAYTLDLVMNPDDEGFSGTVEIDVNIEQSTDKIWLHAKSTEVTRAVASVDGRADIPLTFTQIANDDAPSGIAFLSSETAMPAGKAKLLLEYNKPYNLALNSAYKVQRGDDAYVVTQFEPLGAREAFPSFDEPRFKIPFTISITSPAEDVVIANTPEVSAEPADNGWIKHSFAQTRPLPTYLIAFAVGPYDVVAHDDLPPTEVRDRPIELRALTARGLGDQAGYALEHTAGILEALEEYFGIPYPYEKLGLIAAPEYAFGAMENPGAIVYREYLLLLDENAPLSQKRAYARVHSHELAHQWFGNLVTPYWWEDIWLNEAFATWMGNKGIHIWNLEGNFDRLTLNAALSTMNLDALANTRKIREPLERSERVIDQFDSITYRKGGGVLSMFESYVGEAVFREGVRLHMKRFADDVATADDFFQSIADASRDPNVVDAMKSFVDQPGLPLVRGELTCNAGRTRLSLSQTRYAPLGSKISQGQSWQIPVCAKFGIGPDTEKVCTLMTEAEAELSSQADECADWVTLNDDGAGYYRFSLDDQAWQELLNNLDKLNAREVLAAQDSLDAAFNAGEVDPGVYLKGLEEFAAHPEYDVASSSGDLLTWMYDELPEESRPDLARFIRDIYRLRFDRIRGTDTVEGNLLAPTLATHLVFRGDDKALISELAEQGAAYLGLDGAPDKSATAPNMLSLALDMAMIRRGEETAEPLLELVKSGSALEKSAALGALRETLDPDLAARLREMALSDTETMTGRQASSLIYGLINSEQHETESWAWFQDNFQEFVMQRVPDVRRPGLASYAPGCSAEERDRVESFFESQADLIPGYELKLAQSLEAIELCAARKQALAAKLSDALAERD